MKKTLFLLVIILVIIFSIACNSKEITYTEEFPYLPKFQGMEFKDKQEISNSDYAQATYVINTSNYDSFLIEYSTILEKDGWQIEQNEIPHNMTITKGEHLAVLIMDKTNKDLNLIVITH